MIRFECLEGCLEGRQFTFDQEVVVLGRGPQCDVRLGDTICSRKHAKVELRGNEYFVSDLNSTNGIKVNGKKVVSAALEYGDRFLIGETHFIFLGEVPQAGDGDEADEDNPVIERTQSLGDLEKRLQELNQRAVASSGAQELSMEELADLRSVNRQLHSVYGLSRAINSTLLLADLYELTCEHIFANFKEVERLCIFIHDQESSCLKEVATRSRGSAKEQRVSREILRRVESDRVSILASDARTDERFDSNTLVAMQVRSLLCVPLTTRKKFIGAIYAENCKKVSCFSESDLELLTILGNQVAMAVENALLYEELQVSFYETIRSLGNALEAKDKYTRGHSARVAKYAVGIAQEMHLPQAQIENIRIGAELHDIGKIAIRETIINNSNKLTDEEFDIIKQHPMLGVKILKPIGFLHSILPIVMHHHERYNGQGYPDQLAGEDIPLEARILNLADAFDAMTTQRPYNTPRTFDGALEQCEKEAAVSFDARCVDALCRYIRRIQGRKEKDTASQTQELDPNSLTEA